MVGQISKFLRRTGPSQGYTNGGYGHWCPACEEMHAFAVDGPQSNGARWTFDGNVDLPTFNPSMNIRWGRQADPRCDVDGGACHYHLHAGVLKYCADSTHAMAGLEVPLPPIPRHLCDPSHLLPRDEAAQ